ncbi:DUF533 domain-containing protein [Dankookia sp. GCM10030260]|uniref:DUF533 domain-containing protein n=1 Tax=Dankookia sp. GCM10030260 TaxID=3273390 RepID=UPI0036240DCE
MIDAVKLLGSLLQQGGAPAAQDRLHNAVQRGTGGPLDQAGGGLAGMLSGLFNQGGAGGRGFGEMFGSVTEMAKRAAQAPVEETRANNPAALGGLGAIAGALLGGGRGAVGGGMLALLGSLAYAALQQQQGAAPPPPAEPDAGRLQQKAMLLLRAMIQAAKADGHIDGEEMQRITGRLTEAGETDEARRMVLQEMSRPVDVAGLAAEARDPQEAAEIYAASLLAITVDSQAERDYLARLAAALKLPAEAVAHIRQKLAG